MKVTHIFSDGTKRTDTAGVKVPVNSSTEHAYMVIYIAATTAKRKTE